MHLLRLSHCKLSLHKTFVQVEGHDGVCKLAEEELQEAADGVGVVHHGNVDVLAPVEALLELLDERRAAALPEDALHLRVVVEVAHALVHHLRHAGLAVLNVQHLHQRRTEHRWPVVYLRVMPDDEVRKLDLVAVDGAVDGGDVLDVDDLLPKLGGDERPAELGRHLDPEVGVHDVEALHVLLVLPVEDAVGLLQPRDRRPVVVARVSAHEHHHVVVLHDWVQQRDAVEHQVVQVHLLRRQVRRQRHNDRPPQLVLACYMDDVPRGNLGEITVLGTLLVELIFGHRLGDLLRGVASSLLCGDRGSPSPSQVRHRNHRHTAATLHEVASCSRLPRLASLGSSRGLSRILLALQLGHSLGGRRHSNGHSPQRLSRRTCAVASARMAALPVLQLGSRSLPSPHPSVVQGPNRAPLLAQWRLSHPCC
mmetsp:Transcript_503/g.1748  ORF Transcript_503/g.1748 Transcript_503/m.1748 type:complete len:423 (+) Transcript_503:494-1762(+)